MLLQDIPWVDTSYDDRLLRWYQHPTLMFRLWEWRNNTFDIDSGFERWSHVDHLTAQAVLFHLTLPQEVTK